MSTSSTRKRKLGAGHPSSKESALGDSGLGDSIGGIGVQGDPGSRGGHGES